MEMRRPHGLFSPDGTGPKLSGKQTQQRAVHNGSSSGEGKRGRARSSGEQKKRKATCHPGRFQGEQWEEVVEEGLAGNKYPDMALPV